VLSHGFNQVPYEWTEDMITFMPVYVWHSSGQSHVGFWRVQPPLNLEGPLNTIHIVVPQGFRVAQNADISTLTLLSPVVSNGYTSKCSGPWWSNPHVLSFRHAGTLALEN